MKKINSISQNCHNSWKLNGNFDLSKFQRKYQNPCLWNQNCFLLFNDLSLGILMKELRLVIQKKNEFVTVDE